MKIRIFTIPATGGAALQDELNAFLASQRIIQVDQQFLDRLADFVAGVRMNSNPQRAACAVASNLFEQAA